MYVTPMFYTTEDGTSKALAKSVQAYTNETNVATSTPLVLQGAAARESIPQSFVDMFLNAPRVAPYITPANTPSSPAAAGSVSPVTKKTPSIGGVYVVGAIVVLAAGWYLLKGR